MGATNCWLASARTSFVSTVTLKYLENQGKRLAKIIIKKSAKAKQYLFPGHYIHDVFALVFPYEMVPRVSCV
jgi:hypothetical protein